MEALRAPYNLILETVEEFGYPAGPVVVELDGFEMFLYPRKGLFARALYDGTQNIRGMKVVEDEFSNVFKQVLFDGIVLFDIGANWGYYSLLTYAHCTPQQVVAFEPHPENVEVLQKNAELNNAEIEIVPMAVSDEIDEAILFDYHPGSAAELNSLSTDEHRFDHIDRTEITVNTISIQDYVTSNQIDRIDCVKIDVEGAEGDVLSGVGDVWSRIDGIVLEIHDPRMRDFGHTPTDLIDELADHGPFELFHFDHRGTVASLGMADEVNQSGLDSRFEMTNDSIHILVALRPNSQVSSEFEQALKDDEARI